MSEAGEWEYRTEKDPDCRIRQEHRARLVASLPDVAQGDGFFYRPGQILVKSSDVKLVAADLERAGARLLEGGFGIARYRLPQEVDIPKLVLELRRPRDGVVPSVGPNHVLAGQGVIMGGPATFPEPASEPSLCDRGSGGKGVRIAVFDTGIALHDGAVEEAFLTGHVQFQPSDADPLRPDPADPHLGDEAGHGTFIAGVIREVAPEATIVEHLSLDTHGIGDEATLGEALVALFRRVKPHIVNLSLGGYTFHDMAPIALVAALPALGRDTVIVAAAGNHSSDRPFYPAAMKGVVSVGALSNGTTPAPLITAASFAPAQASYSNYGPWVDACAVGDWVSSFPRYDDPPTPVGNNAVLPERNFQGWARWAGTSFAAPCVAGAIAAAMTTHSLSAPEAAFRLTGASGLRRMDGLGAVVDPPCLGAARATPS